jgi:hypothetical protein
MAQAKSTYEVFVILLVSTGDFSRKVVRKRGDDTVVVQLAAPT